MYTIDGIKNFKTNNNRLVKWEIQKERDNGGDIEVSRIRYYGISLKSYSQLNNKF